MMLKMSKTARWGLAITIAGGMWAGGAQAEGVDGAKLIAANCGTCHTPEANGKFPRISDIRKTPEGWDMTVSRMERWHQVQVDAADRAAIVKHLADTQGLAPAETAPFRYALEQRPGVVEQHADAELGQFCARCHSMARPGLQRRDGPEWQRLVNTHVGQWPSLEFQMMSRDRDWWTTANTTIKDKLAKNWGFASTAWSKWKGHVAPSPVGVWAVSGHHPGKGGYVGTMTVSGGEGDRFAVAYDLRYANGETVKAEGKSVLFTGYEWRGGVSVDGKDRREVYQLSADGARLSGRWFDAVNDELGGDVVMVKTGGKAGLAAVQPQAVKAGATARLALVGSGLDGKVTFGPGVSVLKTEARPWGLEVEIQVDAKARPGKLDAAVGESKLAGALAVYAKVDSVRVEPEMTIARIGDGGGPIPRHYAQFEAVGYLNGKDGKPGTKDDIRLGALPAQWSTDNFDDVAKALEDAKFAGTIDQTGLFTPGIAGPNPERAYHTNNVGNLKVTASLDDGAGGKVGGDAHLIVTVQRWVDGWIR